MKRLKVGVFGMGAIGCSVAAELVLNPNVDLHAFNRSPRGGIHIMRDEGLQSLSLTIKTIPREIELDYLVVCLKIYQYDDAQDWLRMLVSEETVVVIVRNGINHKASLSFLGQERFILPCIIDCPTQLESNGIYRQLNRPSLVMPDIDLARGFAKLFIDAKVSCDLLADFHSATWMKLCESAALGAILCLAGETTWIFNENPKLQELYCDVLIECTSVARADGAILPLGFVDKMHKKVLLYPDNKGSSMLTDRIAGRPIELMAKNGVVSRLGDTYGIATPLNDLICTLLSRTNRGGLWD